MSSPGMSPLPAAKFRNILFATDFSQASMNALPYATGIARKLAASIYLCHIVPPSPVVASVPEVAPALYAEMKEQAAAQLTALTQFQELKDVRATALVSRGPIEDELSRAVQEKKIDLIVAGTHGRTGMRLLLIGSTVEAICRSATCPVLTVGPGLPRSTEIKFHRILFPTDLSEDSKRVLPYLRQVAEEYHPEITVLHVMPEELITNPDAAKLAEPIRDRLIHTFESGLSGFRTEFLIGFGDTVETVLRTAGAKKADLIAMGIHNAFLPGVHLRSSTVYRIMAGANCPVLTSR